MDAWLPLGCALATAACNSLIAGCGKAAERSRLAPMAYAIVFQASAAAVCLAGAAGEGMPWRSARFWALGLSMGVFYVRALTSIVVANGLGPASFPWALANLALVVPIALSAVWLDEPLVPLDGTVFAAFSAMVALFVLGMRSGQAKEVVRPGRYAAALAEVFLANGILMFGYKLKQDWFGPEGSAGFMALVFGCGALLGCMMPAGRAWLTSLPGGSGGGSKWALAAGVLGGLAAHSLLVAVRLPAATVFPIVQGVGLLGGITVTTLAFRERFNGWKVTALVAGLAVVVMAGLRPR
jgi:multidrug transporter EmrE-like cation transporter